MQKHELNYQKEELEAGILHFGVGNFHRAHQAFYTHLLLAEPDQKDWAICGAMIMPADERLYRALKSQDCRYGLTVFGRKGQNEHFELGSLVDLLWAGEDAPAIIAKIADPRIKIISLTITEGGYKLTPARQFDLTDADVRYDLTGPERPRTVFGFIAQGLQKRKAAAAGPLTILSCDNLPHNGQACRTACMTFLQEADQELYAWAKKNISFPNCMVDRITPATLPADLDKLAALNGRADQAPVYCEDFIQWVIEDDFPAGRPAWERVGVQFTNDVALFEAMKLGLVNSTHTMLSFAGLLAGYRKVDEAVANPNVYTYLKEYMEQDVMPYLVAPPGTDLALYKDTFLERLSNQAVSDQLARLCFDAANKIPVFLLPTIRAMLAAGADMRRIAFLLAVYRAYLRRDRDDKGVAYAVDDPGLTDSDHELSQSPDPLLFLGLSCFHQVDFASAPALVASYLKICAGLAEATVLEELADLI